MTGATALTDLASSLSPSTRSTSPAAGIASRATAAAAPCPCARTAFDAAVAAASANQPPNAASRSSASLAWEDCHDPPNRARMTLYSTAASPISVATTPHAHPASIKGAGPTPDARSETSRSVVRASQTTPVKPVTALLLSHREGHCCTGIRGQLCRAEYCCG